MKAYLPKLTTQEAKDIYDGNEVKNKAFAWSLDLNHKELLANRIWGHNKALLYPDSLGFLFTIKKREKREDDLHQTWEQWHQ